MRFCSWKRVQLSFPLLPACFRRAPAWVLGAEGLASNPTRASVGAGVSCCFAGTVLPRAAKFLLCLGCPRHGDSSPWPRQSISSPPAGRCMSFRSCGKKLEQVLEPSLQDLAPWSQHPAALLTQMGFNTSVSGKGKTSRRKPYRLRWRMTVSSVTCGGRATCLWS